MQKGRLRHSATTEVVGRSPQHVWVCSRSTDGGPTKSKASLTWAQPWQLQVLAPSIPAVPICLPWPLFRSKDTLTSSKLPLMGPGGEPHSVNWFLYMPTAILLEDPIWKLIHMSLWTGRNQREALLSDTSALPALVTNYNPLAAISLRKFFIISLIHSQC